MENEKIGKITLDYKHYAGTDLYCDGDVEEEILAEVKRISEENKDSAKASDLVSDSYAEVIEKKASWPFLYHLSPIRENIVSWLPIGKNEKVLEVGSGCGAITGALARKAGSVECVDLSRKRSLINAYRHEACENVVIHVGNFQDIEPDLSCDFDLICLIGVFEYGQAYIGGDNPYETFLNILKKHLAKGGRIAIAIENKFGLKYFAGCKEDHVGKYFEGLHDYPGDSPARTFTERGLLQIAEKCGFSKDDCHMYYPYPDYKFMNTLFSKQRLPKEGELKDNLRNFDRDRLLLFDEKMVFDNILREEEFPLFSNSYMLILGKRPDVSYVRFSNDRAASKCISTSILKSVYTENEKKEDFEKTSGKVIKKALGEQAKAHIAQMAENYKALKKRYTGSRLNICPCRLSEDGLSMEFPMISGISLEQILDKCLLDRDVDGFKKLFCEFNERISYGEGEPVTDMDLIFSNVLVDGDIWTVIDYEWVTDEITPAREIAYRALYCYMLEEPSRRMAENFGLLEMLGLSADQAEKIKKKELLFQKSITGDHKSLGELREAIGNDINDMSEGTGSFSGGRLQVYTDAGSGFSEENSFYADRKGEGFEFKFSGDVKALRLDPADKACVVNLRYISFDEVEANIASLKISSNGTRIGNSVFVFGTSDPNITVHVKGEASGQGETTVFVVFDINTISDSIAKAMPDTNDIGFLGKIKRKLKG